MPVRQIFLDTETTGLGKGNRIIEVACVEFVDRVKQKEFCQRVHPQRDIEEKAYEIHGISLADLAGEPVFAEICEDLLNFVRGAEVIAHNAQFDISMIDFELSLMGRKTLAEEAQCTITDTLAMAQAKHPGRRNRLEDLCVRYAVDDTSRVKHGALLDAQLLAEVYLAMTGGQSELSLDSEQDLYIPQELSSASTADAPVIQASAEEQEEHRRYREFLESQKTTE